MKRNKFFIGCLLSVIFSAVSTMAFADSPVSSNDESVKRVGVAWKVAQDRKIENDGGLYQPEGLDKYMKRYFDQIMEKLDRLSEQNDRLEKKLEELTSKVSKT